MYKYYKYLIPIVCLKEMLIFCFIDLSIFILMFNIIINLLLK